MIYRRSLISVIFIFVIGAASYGQTCSCSNQPQILNPFSFPPGTTVYYKLDPSLANIPLAANGTSPTDQIVSALGGWSTANVTAGGDGITFQPADATHPPTLTIQADSSTTSSAATTTQADDTSGILGPSNPATITFHPFGLINGTSTRGLDETAPGYDTVYLQAALHEIGHVQGIGDYLPASQAPPAGICASVMLPIRGVNDSGNVTPSIPPKTGPTDCDKATAAADSKLAGIPPPSNGDQGGGGSPPKRSDDGFLTQYEVPSGEGPGGGDNPSNESGWGTIIDWEEVPD